PEGYLDGPILADAYHAMDLFAFASKSETQGMVLAEAMTASIPVVALDAPGAREVMRDGENGRLLMDEDVGAFAAALAEIAEQSSQRRTAMRAAAAETAACFSMPRCARRMLDVYQHVITTVPRESGDESTW